jgi:hypothetical protein
VIRGPDGRIARIRYVLPRHKAANWVGPGRGRKSTRPGANGVVELTPFEFLDRLADLVPPPRKHRHRYHGVFAPNHKLRSAVTALAIGNIGKPRDAGAGGHAGEGHATGGCCDANHATLKHRSHDTSRIAWAKLMARVGEEFPLECPGCGGDIRLIAFITQPGPIRKILTHLGEPLEPPPIAAARGPPADWGELIQAHDDREAVQVSPDELPVIDIHCLSAVPGARSNHSPGRATRETVCAETRNSPPEGGGQPFPEPLMWCRKTRHQPHQPPTSSEMPIDMVAEVPSAGLSFFPLKSCGQPLAANLRTHADQHRRQC